MMREQHKRFRYIFLISLLICQLLTAIPVSAGDRSIVESDPVLSMRYEDGMFRYTMPNGCFFLMSCPLGGTTDEPVEVVTGEDTWIISFFEDGESCMPKTDFQSVSEALASMPDNVIKSMDLRNTGSYLFHIRSSVTKKSGRQTYDVYGGFRIAVTDIPVGSAYIEAPYGYEIKEIFLEGRGVKPDGKERSELVGDGSYEVRFSPLKRGFPEWTSRFTKDTTAPALVFTPKITGDPEEGPVSFVPTDSNAAIQILLNNKEVTLHNMTAAADGKYQITVTDTAGNSNEYSFNLEMKEKTSALPYLIIVLVIIILSLLVVLFEHRRMRII